MTTDFCFNSASFPAASRKEADTMLDSLFEGIINLCARQNVLPAIYSDGHLDTMVVATDYTFSDYRSMLVARDPDMADFVFDVDDRSPFVNQIVNEAELAEIADMRLSLFQMDCGGPEYDIVKFALKKDYTLLSLPTHDLWKQHELTFTVRRATDSSSDERSVTNLFDADITLFLENDDWQKKYADIVFSEDFSSWYTNDLGEKDKLRIRNLVRRADAIKFHGTIEQTKAVQGSDGYWEYRGGIPSSGKGRFRLIFKDKGSIHYVLVGFVKHSDADYEHYITRAAELFSTLAHS